MCAIVKTGVNGPYWDYWGIVINPLTGFWIYISYKYNDISLNTIPTIPFICLLPPVKIYLAMPGWISVAVYWVTLSWPVEDSTARPAKAFYQRCVSCRDSGRTKIPKFHKIPKRVKISHATWWHVVSPWHATLIYIDHVVSWERRCYPPQSFIDLS